MKRILLLILIASSAFWSCKKVRPPAPERATLDTLLIAPLSTIRLPVHYRVSELQDMLNAKIKDTFIKRWIVLSDKNDSLYLEVTRNAEIEIKRKERTLFFKIPVRITGKFIAQLAGFRVKNAVPIEAEIILHMSTQLQLDATWNLVPESTIEKIEWIREPSLKVAFINVGLRKPIEKFLLENETQITDRADDVFRQRVNTRKVVQKLWWDIQKPIRINRHGVDVWLKAYGQNLKGRLDETDPDLLSLQIELTAFVKLLIEGDSMPPSNPVLPKYVRNVVEKDSLEIFVHSQINFKRISNLLNRELDGKQLTASGYSATIKEIEVYGTKDNGLAIQMRVKGDVNGKVYFRGKAAFDSLNNTFGVKDFDFDIESESALVSSAGWLLHTAALEMIAEKLVVDVQPFLERLPELITQGIEKGKSGDKMDLNIDTLSMKPIQVITTKNDIQVIVRARGKANLNLEDKVFDKKKKVVAKNRIP